MRKILLPILVFIILALPFLSVLVDQASAASSRVAVIKEMKGTVKVKKSGGSKEFTAFAKMSLNEGDILATSTGGSVVLQFANGTSDDDKMTVSANTTLTFSKLSNSKGTSTKVTMFNGSAWVDVKSITSKNDEFSLETPTAVMGVRGTHLLVSVDPVTGATRLTVAAGVVSAQSAGSTKSQDVLPTKEALFTNVAHNEEVTIAPADLELLMKQNDKSIIEAIVAASGDIVKENNEKMDQYLAQSGVQTPNDSVRQKSNVDSLLGAIVDKAVQSGLISQERVNQLITEAQIQTGVTIDLTKKDIQLSEEEKRQQEAQRLKDEESKKQAEEIKQKEDEERKKNDSLLKQLEEQRKLQEQANKKAEEENNKKATDEYKQSLSDADKQKFEVNQKTNEQATTPTSTSSGSGPTTPTSPILKLNNLTLHYYEYGTAPVFKELEQFHFSSSKDQYEAITVSANIMGIYLKPEVAAVLNVSALAGEYHYVLNNTQGFIFIPLKFGTNNIVVSVYDPTIPANHKDYVLQIDRRKAPDALDSWEGSVTSDVYGVTLPEPKSVDLIYWYKDSYVYQSDERVGGLSFDLHYDSTKYTSASISAQYYPYTYTGTSPLVPILTPEPGHLKILLKDIPQGTGLLTVMLNSEVKINLFLLNGVSEPKWNEMPIQLGLYDVDKTKVISDITGPDSSGTYSVHVQGGRIRIDPKGYSVSAYSNAVGLVEYPTADNGYKFYINKPVGASTSTLTINAYQDSGYFNHSYPLKIYWDSYSDATLSSFALKKTSSVGESVYFDFASSTEQYDIDLGLNNFVGYMAASPSVTGAPVKYKVDSGSYVTMNSGYYVVDVSSKYTVVTIQVTALDGVTTKTYEFRLRRPIPQGIALWTTNDNSIKWQLFGTYADGGAIYQAFTAVNSSALSMNFDFSTTGSPIANYVKITKLIGVSDINNVNLGTQTGTPWESDLTGNISITDFSSGKNYYRMQVFNKTGEILTPIGVNHYLEFNYNYIPPILQLAP
jgi:hypothetical protein